MYLLAFLGNLSHINASVELIPFFQPFLDFLVDFGGDVQNAMEAVQEVELANTRKVREHCSIADDTHDCICKYARWAWTSL